MRIALLPLDERPVNTRLVRDLGAVGGHDVLVPPAQFLPRRRTPGDADWLAAWLSGTVPLVDAAIISIDTLCYGGLIASRTSDTPVLEAMERLAAVGRLRAARPDVDLSAMSLVMRASDSDDNSEEPTYWADYGKELHRFGGRLHGAVVADATGRPTVPIRAEVPDQVVSDFVGRRLRNHLVNLESLRLAVAGELDTLMVTADDTAVRSAGSAEQLWIRHWCRALRAGDNVRIHSGADEVGAVLLARATGRCLGPLRIAVVTVDPQDLEVVPPYENRTVQEALDAQLVAAGGIWVGIADHPDLALVVHAPDGRSEDWYSDVPPSADPARGPATAHLVAETLEAGIPVAVADILQTNGGDPTLIDALKAGGLIEHLVGYSGWNTASNSIGSALAAGIVTIRARHQGNADEGARHRLVLHRIIEDVAYQSLARTRLLAEARRQGWKADAAPLAVAIGTELNEYLRGLDHRPDPAVCSVQFPWERPFEIDFELR